MNKLIYFNQKEAEFVRTTLSYQLKKYDIPKRDTRGREVLRNVIKRLFKAFPVKRVKVKKSKEGLG